MTSPIIALDHLRISVADLNAATADYQLLLGAEPQQVDADIDREATQFDAGNIKLLLVESEHPQGLETICFQVDSLDRIQRRLKRLGLDPKSAEGETSDEILRVETRGLDLRFVTPPREPASRDAPALVSGLDHVVIASADAQASAFLLAAQLGLDMRMDMSRPKWGARLLFFRCGDSIVEVVQNLGKEGSPDLDKLFGISWRVHDADAAHLALSGSGFDVSEVRSGRRPGTRVLTARDRTAGVATLLLEPPRS